MTYEHERYITTGAPAVICSQCWMLQRLICTHLVEVWDFTGKWEWGSSVTVNGAVLSSTVALNWCSGCVPKSTLSPTESQAEKWRASLVTGRLRIEDSARLSALSRIQRCVVFFPFYKSVSVHWPKHVLHSGISEFSCFHSDSGSFLFTGLMHLSGWWPLTSSDDEIIQHDKTDLGVMLLTQGYLA